MLFQTMAKSCLMAAVVTAVRRCGVRPVSAFSSTASLAPRSSANRATAFSSPLFMSTSTPPTAAAQATKIIPRVKAADATEPTDSPVVIKGWVRTVRKQKTLAFVEVNDGSNLAGIQCVLTFDDIDDESRKGAFDELLVLVIVVAFPSFNILFTHIIL